jgi:hypothetical protein
MIRGNFRPAKIKRGLWTLEAVPGQIAILSPQVLAQPQRARQPTASGLNKPRGLFEGSEVLDPERDKSSTT